MRIAMTHPESLGAAGGGTVGLLHIARALRTAGHDVVLFPVARGPRAEGAWAAELTREIRPAPVHHTFDGIPAARELRSAMSARPFDAIVGWGPEAAFSEAIARRHGAVTAMVAAKPSYAAWHRRRVRFRAVKRISDHVARIRPLRRADVVFTLSAFTRDELVATFGLDPARIVVAPWGVDPSFARIPRAHPERISRLFFAGTLAPHKGVFDAISALGEIANDGNRAWTLRIAGWGDEEAVRAAAAAHGIADRVTLLGRLDHERLADELAGAHLAVLPSHVESFGLAIAEAQAAGLPVVSYAVGAVPEVVDAGRTGMLVRSGDIAALSGAIRALMDDPARAHALGMAARARVSAAFSWDRTAGIMASSLEAALGRAGSRREASCAY